MSRRVILTLLILLIIICLCLCLILVPGAFLYMRQGGLANLGTTPTPTATVPPLPTSPVSGNLPADIEAQMSQIQEEVVALRGLIPDRAVPQDVLTAEQLRENVVNDFFTDYPAEDAQADARLLNALGLLEPDFDLLAFYRELYSEQVAGYYDSETEEMYVVQGEGFQGLERMTYAHEYTHALQDQHYDLDEGMQLNNEYCEDHSEYCAAIQALIEGDASVTESMWFFTYGTELDQQQLLDFYQSYTSPVYDSAPAFMQEDFIFPYTYGQEFVQSLYDIDGWQAVDDAYLNPPQSTEQILHPERYPEDTPETIELPDLASALGSNWVDLEQNVLGEWYTYLVLAQGWLPETRLDESQARDAAAGWEGDAYLMLTNETDDQWVLLQQWLWESQPDVDEFWEAINQYGAARWGEPDLQNPEQVTWANTDDGWVSLNRSGLYVTWAVAPDEATSELLSSEIFELQE